MHFAWNAELQHAVSESWRGHPVTKDYGDVHVFSDNKILLKHLLELNVVVGLTFLGSDCF